MRQRIEVIKLDKSKDEKKDRVNLYDQDHLSKNGDDFLVAANIPRSEANSTWDRYEAKEVEKWLKRLVKDLHSKKNIIPVKEIRPTEKPGRLAFTSRFRVVCCTCGQPLEGDQDEEFECLAIEPCPICTAYMFYHGRDDLIFDLKCKGLLPKDYKDSSNDKDDE